MGAGRVAKGGRMRAAWAAAHGVPATEGEPGKPPRAKRPPKVVTRGRAGWCIYGQPYPALSDVFGSIPSEAVEGMRLMQWLRRERDPGLRASALRIFHVPNGGKRGRIEASRMKGEGVRAGVPDYILPVPVDGWPGLYLELKKHDGMPEKHQLEEMAQLQRAGYLVVIAWTGAAAAEVVMAYLRGEIPRP